MPNLLLFYRPAGHPLIAWWKQKVFSCGTLTGKQLIQQTVITMIKDPNVVYFIALFVWPFIAYKIYTRFSLDRAVFLLLFIPYLFLPVPLSGDGPIKLPLLPPIDKNFIPPFSLFLILLLKKVKVDYFPKFGWLRIILAGLIVSPIISALNNGHIMPAGPNTIPGMAFKDGVVNSLQAFWNIYFPFVLGFQFLRSNEAHANIVRIICWVGLCYTLLMLWEVRMSPQLHTQIYGYFPHEWIQQFRSGGYRPVVFLGHGLLVALLGCFITICVYTLWRKNDPSMKSKGLFLFLYMVFVLILCKTYSALIYFMFFLAASLFLSEKMRLKVAVVIAVVFLTFPIVRSYLPLVEITEFFSEIDEARASSLAFRFRNEDQLLDKAMEQKWFGWGGWGRNRIYDPVSGRDLSVTDGAWIIYFGVFGWIGYLAFIGILSYPILSLNSAIDKKNEKDLTSYTFALVMILAISMIDQIPNASLRHMTYLIAGAILGRSYELNQLTAKPSKKGTTVKT